MKEKILVIRLSSLGDIMLTAPVYRNIKAAWPSAEICLLVKPQFKTVFEKNSAVDRVIVFEGLFKTIKRIRAEKFTHALDLHANLRSFFITLFGGAQYKERYKKFSLARKLFVTLRKRTPALSRHTVDKYLEPLKKWNIPIIHREPVISDWRAGRPEYEGSKKLNICIFNPSFLGDAVLTIPLIKKTAELYPDAKISVVCRPESADIFKPCSEVKIITDNKRQKPFLTAFKEMSAKLKDGNFDVIIICHRSFRSAFLAYLAGIPRRVGFSSSAGGVFLTDKVPFSYLLHDAERNISLLSALTMDVSAHSLDIAGNVDKLDISAFAGENLDGVSLAGIHPGSAWETKKWPKEKFAKLISRLWKEKGIKSVIVGGKDDAALCAEIAEISDGKPINLSGKTSLAQLIALIKNFRFFITNDSGPMHIATALQVPVTAVFGPTTKELGFFPYGGRHKVVEAGLPCRPCALHGAKKCPRGHFLCMRLIKTDDVFRAIFDDENRHCF